MISSTSDGDKGVDRNTFVAGRDIESFKRLDLSRRSTAIAMVRDPARSAGRGQAAACSGSMSPARHILPVISLFASADGIPRVSATAAKGW